MVLTSSSTLQYRICDYISFDIYIYAYSGTVNTGALYIAVCIHLAIGPYSDGIDFKYIQFKGPGTRPKLLNPYLMV